MECRVIALLLSTSLPSTNGRIGLPTFFPSIFKSKRPSRTRVRRANDRVKNEHLEETPKWDKISLYILWVYFESLKVRRPSTFLNALVEMLHLSWIREERNRDREKKEGLFKGILYHWEPKRFSLSHSPSLGLFFSLLEKDESQKWAEKCISFLWSEIRSRRVSREWISYDFTIVILRTWRDFQVSIIRLKRFSRVFSPY